MEVGLGDGVGVGRSKVGVGVGALVAVAVAVEDDAVAVEDVVGLAVGDPVVHETASNTKTIPTVAAVPVLCPSLGI